MKKMLTIVLVVTIELIILARQISPVFIEKIDLKLRDNELAITFLLLKDNKSLLLNTKDQKILIVLNLKDKHKLLNNLEHFNSDKLDYLLGFEYYDIESSNKMIIKDNLKIDDITINEHNRNLQINYLDHNFCFYFDNYNQDFPNCHYIYLEHPNDDTKFMIEPELILFDKLNEEFTEEMYDQWIDTFYLEPAYYNVVKLNKESYNIINIPIKN